MLQPDPIGGPENGTHVINTANIIQQGRKLPYWTQFQRWAIRVLMRLERFDPGARRNAGRTPPL